MSSMLEQAIIDAAALREAALKNAEQSLIEKYAPQIKEAVDAMLETGGPSARMKYEGRVVNVVHEADNTGNVTVSEGGGKPFVVKESDLSSLTEEELLQEEEMDMGGGTEGAEGGGVPSAEIEAPFSGNPQIQSDEIVNLTLDVDALDHEIDIDLDRLESELAGETMPEDDMASIGDMGDELGMEEEGGDLFGGEEEGEELGGDLGGEEELGGEEAEETELQLQELLNLLDEHEVDTLEEIVSPGGVETEEKDGWFRTAVGPEEYEQDIQLAANNLYEDEDESAEDLDEEEGTSQLYETIELFKSQNLELETVVYKLSDKLEETLLSNAKLIYQNRTLCDASLNERQKEKIVEAISKAESPKEAKHLQETLRTTVGSRQKKGPQSLSETVNRRSNLSGMLNRRQNLNESQTSDPLFDKMRRLAGIKK